MTNVILISESYIKENSALNENYFGHWLRPAIKDAQRIGLVGVIGDCLYNKIIDLVSTGDISLPENVAYKDLLDNYIRDYLLYKVLMETVPIANVKLANIGTKLTEDERIISLSQGETDLLQHNFSHKADYYKKQLQNFILRNIDAFPEIDECCTCDKYINKPHLKETADTGVWLGGEYGKRI